MNDIVERLRGWAQDARLGRRISGADQDLFAAAAEIARLSARVAELEGGLVSLEKAAQRYLEISEHHISGTAFDADGCLAEANAELAIIALPRARALTKGGE